MSELMVLNELIVMLEECVVEDVIGNPE